LRTASPLRSSVPHVAVVGCGYWGRNLVRNYYALGALAAVVDATDAGRATAAELAPGIDVIGDLDEVLARPDIDAVAIATPAATHATIGLKAMDAGKDVMMEKPMALSVADGRALVARATAGQRILQVGHLLEYHPAVVILRQWMAAGRVGRILRLHSHRMGFGLVRTEEDALWSLAPHDLSLILRFTGTLPAAVTCHGSRALGTTRADFAVTMLHFGGGLEAHLLSSWLHPMKEQRLVIVGERGMAVFDDTFPDNKLAFYDHHVDWSANQPVLHRGATTYESLPVAEPLRVECAAFLHSIAKREQPFADGHSGLQVIAVLDACQRSMEAGGLRTAVESV
jgi:predicted dehydrogenase